MRTNDPLRNLNWQQVYDEAPMEVRVGAGLAHARIRAREARKRRMVKALACAACLALALGAGIWMLGKQESAPDRISTPLQEKPALRGNDVVYASMEDACFHLTPACESAGSSAVQLKLVTALEFEKQPCPQCAAGVVLMEEK